MEILEYFALSESEQAHWRDEIGRGDWRAAAFLRDRLENADFFERYGSGSRLLLGASESGALMAFCTLAERDDVADIAYTPWIGFVYTFPEYRGHRLSGAMIERACALARADGFSRIYLSTTEVGLYEKYGFSFLKDARDVWSDPTRIFVRQL